MSAIKPISFNEYVTSNIERTYNDTLMFSVYRIKGKQKIHVLYRDAVEQCRQIYNYEIKNNLIQLGRFVDVNLDKPLSSTIIDTYSFPIPQYKRELGLTYQEIETIYGFSMIVPNKEDEHKGKFSQFNMTTNNIFELTGNIEYYFSFDTHPSRQRVTKYIDITPVIPTSKRDKGLFSLPDMSRTIFSLMDGNRDELFITIHSIKYSAYVKGQDFGEITTYINDQNQSDHVLNLNGEMYVFPLHITRELYDDLFAKTTDDTNVAIDEWFNDGII